MLQAGKQDQGQADQDKPDLRFPGIVFIVSTVEPRYLELAYFELPLI